MCHGRCKSAPHFHFQERSCEAAGASARCLLEAPVSHAALLHFSSMETVRIRDMSAAVLCFRGPHRCVRHPLTHRAGGPPQRRGKWNGGQREAKHRSKKSRDGGVEAVKREWGSAGSRGTLCRKLIGADSSGFKVCLFMTGLLPR